MTDEERQQIVTRGNHLLFLVYQQMRDPMYERPRPERVIAIRFHCRCPKGRLKEGRID